MSSEQRLTGMVKWFNSRAGYGFITICGETRDIFVHYSNIKSENLPYTYLTQGEYVEFDLASTDNNEHKHQAVNITGIRGGPIMCESKRNERQHSSRNENGSPVSGKRVPKTPRARDLPKPNFDNDEE